MAFNNMQWLMFFTFISWLLILITLSVDIWSVVKVPITAQGSALQYFGLFRARGNTGKDFSYTDVDVPLAPMDDLHRAGSGAFVMLFLALLMVTLSFVLMAMILTRKLEMDSGVLTILFTASGFLIFGGAACWFGAGHFKTDDLYNRINIIPNQEVTLYLGGSLVLAVITGVFVCVANAYASSRWKSKLNTSATI